MPKATPKPRDRSRKPAPKAPKPEQYPNRIRTTSFHITISTNQRYGSREAITADMRPFYDGLRQIFGEGDNVVDIMSVLGGPPGNPETGAPPPPAEIGHSESDIGIEYGARAGMHAHVLLTVTHKGKLQINLPKLREKLKTTLPSEWNAYVNVRFLKNQNNIVRNYVYKTIGGSDWEIREDSKWVEPLECECRCKIGDMTSFFPS